MYRKANKKPLSHNFLLFNSLIAPKTRGRYGSRQDVPMFFLVVSKSAEFLYKTSEYYTPDCERVLL